MTRRWRLIAAVVATAAACAMAWLLFSRLTASPATGTDLWRVSPASLDRAIDASADYLINMLREDGSFTYRINLDPTVKVPAKYNMLRHAGTMYALGMYHGMGPQDERIRDVLTRSGSFLRAQIDAIPGHDELLAVWSRAAVERGGDEDEAKLGGTGLGLVALLTLERIAPGSIPLEELRSLARFLCHMQKADGSFYSKYVPSRGGRDDSWTSLYYPGEAALGMILLYEIDPQPQWIETAARALDFLARSREGRREVEVDHWALLASARLLPHVEKCSIPNIRERLIAHAVQQCETIVRTQIVNTDNPARFGAFHADGRTTPASTRLEGLLAALTFLPAEHDILREWVTAATGCGLEFLLHAQIRQGPHRGGMPRAMPATTDETADSDMNSDRRASEIRIDYVQHALSAMIQARELYQLEEAARRQ